ncbi:MAG: protoglobin domain-containing protein [Myxococcota bacterium]|nr:protoglobin domain-containing protein [Myxococcota bacterium]
MAETLFEELKRYTRWDDADEQSLRALHPLAQPHFVRVAEVFYDRILTHEEARRVLEGGESTVGRLKITLVQWMETLLQGPWDEHYYERRARIGRVHVRIALPQHYMFGAMNVVRQEFNALIDDSFRDLPDQLHARRVALSKILDLELAIMLHTYREDLLSQQARVERLSTFGQLVGSIGHELRNPLSVIETSLFILKGRLGDDERARKHTDRIGEQVKISNDIITQLLDMIRDRPLNRARVALPEVISDAARSVQLPPGVTLELSGVEALPTVSGDAGQLRQVVLNLMENAVHACGETGQVKLTGSTVGGSVELAVEDSGPGVDPAIKKRLFEPLVTTKTKGIGLGLALVKRIVERHQGSITYQQAALGGARFVVRLPQA